MANKGPNLNASALFITLSDQPLEYLNKKHTIFGEVTEGLDVLEKINKAYLDKDGRPYQNIRIKHTLIIDDPFEEDPKGMKVPSRSPSPIVTKKIEGAKNFDILNEDDDDRLEDDIDL